jgi:ABC-type enterobactin transport system permease subunit
MDIVVSVYKLPRRFIAVGLGLALGCLIDGARFRRQSV